MTDALLLAAGKLAGEGFLASLKSHQRDHLSCPGIAFFCRLALHAQRKGDIVQHIEMRQQSEVLEHHAHFPASQFNQALGVGDEQIFVIQQHLSTTGLDEPRQAAYQRGFSGTRQSHDDENLAGMNDEIGIDNGRNLPAAAQLLTSGRAIAFEQAIAAAQAIGLGTVDLPQVSAR